MENEELRSDELEGDKAHRCLKVRFHSVGLSSTSPRGVIDILELHLVMGGGLVAFAMPIEDGIMLKKALRCVTDARPLVMAKAEDQSHGE